MPEMTVRSSTRGFPGLPCGRWGSNIFHAASDSQNKLLAMPSASSDSNHGKNISWNQSSVWVLNLDDIHQIRASLGLPAEPENGADLGLVPPDLDQTFSSVRQAQSATGPD